MSTRIDVLRRALVCIVLCGTAFAACSLAGCGSKSETVTALVAANAPAGATTGGGGGTTGGVVPTPGVVVVPASGNIGSFSASGSNVLVTSANTFSAGDVIVISGSTFAAYNKTFTVVSATPSGFTILVAGGFAGTDTASSWTSKPAGILAGCSTTGSTAAITLPLPAALNNIPSRFTGVAPLAIFFDTVGTTATSTVRPFHELEYQWNFGDPAGGATWANGNRPGVNSKNAATGPVAAHVFETPGAYTVTLTVTDGANTVTNACIQVTVQDPDVIFAGANTICFSTSGTFTGAPTGTCAIPGTTAITTSNLTTAVQNFAAPGKRLLFRRGEAFTAQTGGASLKVNGPGIIGAFGTGARPKFLSVALPTPNTILIISSNSTPNIKDWRIMDAELDGQSNAMVTGVNSDGGFDQLTLLRLNTHDIGTGISFSPSTLQFYNATPSTSGHRLSDQLAIVDSVVQRVVGGGGNVGMFIGATRLSILGNLGDDSTLAEHVVRLQYVGRGVFSNNTLSQTEPTKHVLTIRGACFVASCPGGNFQSLLPNGSFTEKVIVSDNKFVGLGNPISVQYAPSNPAQDERLRDFISERNLYLAGVGSQFALIVQAADVTIRNEICDMTGGAFHVCMAIQGVATAPASSNVHLYHNTFFSNSPQGFAGADFAVGVTGSRVINNLAFAPNATVGPPATVRDNTVGGLTQSNNTSNAQLLVTPGFAATPPVLITDWKPSCAGPLIYPCAQGITVPVWSDFFRVKQPAARDLGAVIH